VRDSGDTVIVPSSAGAVVVYDGDCPVCNAYVQYVRLRESVGPVQIVNARMGGEWVELTHRLGLNLDRGMVLFYGGRAYYGADCMHMIAVLSSASGMLNRVSAKLLRNRRLARLSYPVLRAGRTLLLFLLGRRRLGFEAHSKSRP
jgi:predicted DCC family thiol-disulfide oxidoreductase YuxK